MVYEKRGSSGPASSTGGEIIAPGPNGIDDPDNPQVWPHLAQDGWRFEAADPGALTE